MRNIVDNLANIAPDTSIALTKQVIIISYEQIEEQGSELTMLSGNSSGDRQNTIKRIIAVLAKLHIEIRTCVLEINKIEHGKIKQALSNPN